MIIEWKKIEDEQMAIINGWLSKQDKQNLCMTQKGWEQTAADIEDCLKIMDNSQFANIMGYVNGTPVVALMFGVEHIKVLNLYNIVINPYCRRMGVAKHAILQLLKNDKSLQITKPYSKVVASTLPENVAIMALFQGLNFENMGYDGEYFVFEKDVSKQNEVVR